MATECPNGPSVPSFVRTIRDCLRFDDLVVRHRHVTEDAYVLKAVDPETTESHVVLVVPNESESVTTAHLRSLARLQTRVDADSMAVTTDGRYTDGAEAFAREHGVDVVVPGVRDGGR